MAMKKLFTNSDLLEQKKRMLTSELSAKMDQNMRDVTVLRKLYQEKQEVDLEEALARAKESAGWRVEELKQEEALAYHIDKAKQAQMNENKRRQLIWQTKEIMDLKNSLKIAYYQKELYSRRELSASKKEQERHEDDWYVKKLEEEANLRYHCDLKQKETADLKKKRYKESLQDQIIDNHKLKIAAYKKKLEDAALINDAVRTALAEDEREELENARIKQLLKEEIESFKKAKTYWIGRERDIQEEENRKIVSFLNERNERERQLQLKNLQMEDAKLKKQDAVIMRIKQLEGARLEREHIAGILLDEEARVKGEREDKMRREEAIRFKKEMRDTFKTQLELKLAAKEEEKRLDREYAMQLKQQLEEDRVKEQMEIFETRQRRLQYGNDLRKCLEDLDRHRFQELLLSIKEEEGLKAERDEQIRLINEERIKMINEHCPHLIGFLRPGFIRDEEVPLLSLELKNALKLKDASFVETT